MSVRITFGRSESWTSGWMGKQSVQPIRVGAYDVAEIRGQESSGVSGMMHYSIWANGRQLPHDKLPGRFFSSQKEAREAAPTVLPRFLVAAWGEGYAVVDRQNTVTASYAKFRTRDRALEEARSLNAQARAEGNE